MTRKAYIVANEQQEREVLEKLEQEGLTWNYSMKKITQVIPSHYPNTVTFPYSLRVFDSYVFWDWVDEVKNDEIVYDGRKEEKMSNKYVVSQEFMNELEEWTATRALSRAANCFVDINDIEALPMHIETWWGVNGTDTENNNRLIAIIRWVNGEDVFEVEKPKKWVVRSKDIDKEDSHLYVKLYTSSTSIPDITTYFGSNNATRFDTKEEADSWANSHQEVIEVEE